MKSIKKLSIIALLLLLVGTTGSFVAFQFIDKSASIEQTIEEVNITNIEISANNDRVELVPANDSDIKVELEGRRTRNLEDRLRVNIDGDTLFIQTEEQNKLFKIDLFEESRELTVYLPDKVYQSLEVDMGNGSFQASKLNINAILAKTDNGHVEMDTISANSIEIESNNGRVHLADVDGKISGKTNNGSFSLATSDLERSIEWEANNGSIEIVTEKEPTNTMFDLKTTNGKAEVFGASNWDIAVGNGEHVIKLTTINGNISIEK